MDRGAGEGVRVMLFKRDATDGKRRDGKNHPKTLFQHQEDARAAAGNKPSDGPKDRRGRQRHLKRDFSPKERERLAASGAAMPGGGYPIASVEDLKNAIHAIGRAKNPGKTRAHIVSRARALGHADLIPEGWSGTMKSKKALLKIARDLGTVTQLTKGAISFNQVITEMSSPGYALGFIQSVKESCHALKDSIESICECDEMMPADRAAAISESYGQFMNHLSGLAPANITKALKEGVGSMSKLTKKLMKAYAAGGTPVETKKVDPKEVEKAAAAEAAAAAAASTTADLGNGAITAKQFKKLAAKFEKRLEVSDTRLTAALSMSKAEKDYMDDPDADMDDEKKKIFLDMSAEERTKFIVANPLDKIAEKRVAALPEPIRKQLAQSGLDSVELAKRIEADEMREFGKRAAEIGQPEAFGAGLRTLAKGLGTEEDRTKALDEVLTIVKAAVAQAKAAGLFSEFGTNRGATGTAWDQLMGKAEEHRNEVNKSGAGRPLTPEQAFAKVYEDPANSALVKQYNEEKRRAA